MLDPPPIVRSTLTNTEREASYQELNLDTPIISTYRQDRASQARQGADLRESSLSEMHQRRNARPRVSSAAVSVANISSNISTTAEAVSSQKSNVEALMLHNWQVRETDRHKEGEERRRREEVEKEERERRELIERGDRDRRDEKEEMMRALDREDKERMSMLMFKLLGNDLRQKALKKEIKVVDDSDAESQPLPVKLKLSSLSSLKKDLSTYMEEPSIDGIVLVEEDEGQVILTEIDELLESEHSQYVVSKLVKRGKSYLKLVSY